MDIIKVIPKEQFTIDTKNEHYRALKTTTSKILHIEYLPPEVMISTMTVCCNMNISFNCNNIAKYVALSFDSILSVSCGKAGDARTNRTLIKKRNSSGKKKKQKKCFYNQVSMYINISSKKKKPVNVKLFCDGAIQMTGCKTIEHVMEALSKIIYEFKKVKAIVDSKTLKVVEKPFVSDISKLHIKNIYSIKIAMINSGFDIAFPIDRQKLYDLIISDNRVCTFDTSKHACVNIKFEHPEKTISIFVFEKGSIIITGAQNCKQINGAYDFINKFLLINHLLIKKNNAIINSNIEKYLGVDKKNKNGD